ncbi:MAG: dienelactone hydrolase family protein [Elusimicrobia bacterium]|nr:dienelactone hydrolase family protein [Elusimicrobiota bacterium]
MRFGELDAIEYPSRDPMALTVVCLHGYGADMRDLAPLAPEIPVERPVRWVFPDAPEILDWGGRAWFPIDVEVFEEAQRTGKPRDLSGGEPAGMAEARAELSAALEELEVPPEKLVLMGFSQGAMMSVDMSLRLPGHCAGVAILSGTLVDRDHLSALAPSKKGTPFFQSHGSVDPILNFSQALALEKELKSAGWKGELRRFEGGHAIPPEIVLELGAWLEGL